jgi:ankyrin repeat protein
MSASPSSSIGNTPISSITHYLKNLLGLNYKTTKRSLSEEAECGAPDSLQEWLRLGSDPNEIDAYGYTPLVNACLRGCIRSVRILVENGANVNMKAMHGYYPLHAAAQNGHTEIVELLIENSAQTELKNDDGDTPLMLAVRSNHQGVVEVLCKAGCNLHTQGFDHIEPIDYAINKRNIFISDVLMKHERQHLNSASTSLVENNSNSLSSSFVEDPAATPATALELNSSKKLDLTDMIHHEQDHHLQREIDTTAQK